MKWIKRILLGLAAVVVLSVLGLLAAGQRQDAGVFRAAVDVNRPAAEVYPYLDDPARLKGWVSWLKEIREVGGGRVWVMEDRNNNNALMEMKVATLKADPPRQLTVRAWAEREGFDGQVAYTLTPLPTGGTHLEQVSSFTYNAWIFRMLEPLITPSAGKKAQGDLERLKALAEQ